MSKRFSVATVLIVAFTPALACAQTVRQPGAKYDFDVKDQKPAPAPSHNISGVWEPAKGAGDAIQANGAKAMPSDGKREHDLHFTPAGEEAFKAHKPGLELLVACRGEIVNTTRGARTHACCVETLLDTCCGTENNRPGVGTSADAARTSACATMRTW
jgi:hypothetical protein